MRLGVAPLVLMVALVAACSPTAPPPTPTAGPAPTDSPQTLLAEMAALPAGDPSSGKMLFSAEGCVACHSLEVGVRVVGPSLNGVATRAATRRPGYSAALYLYESITRPNAYVVAGFPSSIMPQNFRQRLKPQELADVLAFLLTQK